MGLPKVSVIILNWNGVEDTMECLESLKRMTYNNYEVIVIDNGSEGDDVKVLRKVYNPNTFLEYRASTNPPPTSGNLPPITSPSQ